MKMRFNVVIFVVFCVLTGHGHVRGRSEDGEAECSRFGFEMKLMERLVLLEQKDKEIEKLKERQAVLENQNRELMETIERQRADIERNFTQHGSRLQRLEQAGNAPVVEAQLRSGITLHPSQTIIFNHPIINVGEAYDTDTGIFTVPTDGTYLFAVTLCIMYHANNKGTYASVEVMRGSVAISLLQYSSGPTKNGCTTDVVTSRLRVGETIWVKVKASASATLQDVNYGLSSFTAVMVNY